jgi:hypothetical protein
MWRRSATSPSARRDFLGLVGAPFLQHQ